MRGDIIMAGTRRVGSVTMGICLIVYGIYMLIVTLFPNSDIWHIMKFSPLFLIILGIEILYNSYFHKNEDIKFDFLSIVMCFVIIMTSLGMWVFTYIMLNFSKFYNFI
ncbi:hypothetical protein B5E58_01095 [Tyzzerella sp. An114]|nr:hypothetical protein B5E58_01095 [Tyzzerella sp. An114]